MRKLFKSIIKGGLIALVILGIAIQFVPRGRDHTNPPVLAEPAWDSAQTRDYFFRACADCHSNETVWPWYSHVAPISWLVEYDVQTGRAEFNISEWAASGGEGDDAAETVQDGSMPPSFYLITHPAARLSAAEKQTLMTGLIATFGGEGGGEAGGDGENDDEDDD